MPIHTGDANATMLPWKLRLLQEQNSREKPLVTAAYETSLLSAKQQDKNTAEETRTIIY